MPSKFFEKLSSMIFTDGTIESFDYTVGLIRIQFRDYAETEVLLEIDGVTAIKVAGSIIGYRVEKSSIKKDAGDYILEFLDEDNCRFENRFPQNSRGDVTFR